MKETLLELGQHVGRLYPHSEVRKAVPEYGFGKPVVKVRYIALDNATTLRKTEIGGNVLWVLDCSSRTAYAEARINDQQRDPIRLREGLFIKGMAFSRMYISWAAQPGEYIRVYYAHDEMGIFDIKNPALQFTQVDFTKASVLESLADINCPNATLTQVLAANATRRAAIFGALAANTGTVRIGDNQATATRGQELAPGDSITLSTSEAIYVYNNSGAAQTISRIWTED